VSWWLLPPLWLAALVGTRSRSRPYSRKDAYTDCPMISAEIEANNVKVTELANEQGWKVA